MDVSYIERGRTDQKRRTRAALVEAAATLVAEGRTPTVPEVAAAAGVSRATAYRYFPAQEALLAETVFVGPSFATTADSLAALVGGEPDPAKRVAVAVETLTAFMVDNHPALRAMLKASLEARPDTGPDTTLPVRQGRRATVLEEALAPLRGALGDAELRRLNAALGIVIGTEALVVLRDVYEIEGDEALEVMRWAAMAIYQVATMGEPPAR